MTKRRRIAKTGTWYLFVGTIAFLAMASATPPGVPARDGADGPSVELLRSEVKNIRDAAVDSLLHNRRAMAQELIRLVDPANAEQNGEGTRVVAAYLLGEMRAAEAVPVLSKALPERLPDKLFYDRIDRYDMAIWRALVRIGRPAVPAMIENIETSDHRMLRIRSLDVLNHVLGGKRRLLELLDKLEARSTDPEKTRRIQEARVRVQEHFKEDEEPLY